MGEDQVLKLGGDASGYISEMGKARKSTMAVAKSATSIGDEFLKGGAKLETFKRAIETAGRAISATLAKAEEASRTGGNRAIGLAVSLAGLGVKDIGKTSAGYLSAGGIATNDERTAFAASLESTNKARQAPMQQGQIQAALQAFAHGGSLLYGEGGKDLTKGLGEGLTVEEITRRQRISRPGILPLLRSPNDAATSEFALRREEDDLRLRQEAQRRAGGNQIRRGEITLQERALGNKGADIMLNIMGETVGKALGAVAGGREDFDAITTALDTQTSIMLRQQTPRPTNTTEVPGTN
jgi:hypothetical protein